MLEILEWLEASALGAITRESLYGFPVLVGIHILGLIFSVGILFWVDLRMIGVCLKGYPLIDVYRALSKWFVFGFSVMLLSGFALFAGFATSAYENTFFRIKILVIILAGINAIAFHFLVRRMPAEAASADSMLSVRLMGIASISFWAVVILCGRMISYTLF